MRSHEIYYFVTVHEITITDHDNLASPLLASLATLINTSSKVVSANPHAWMLNLVFAFSTARKTLAMVTSDFGNSNFCVPESPYTFVAFGDIFCNISKTDCSSCWAVVMEKTYEPPYRDFNCTNPMHTNNELFWNNKQGKTHRYIDCQIHVCQIHVNLSRLPHVVCMHNIEVNVFTDRSLIGYLAHGAAFPQKITIHALVYLTSLELPIHCKFPSTNIPRRSHSISASSIECATYYEVSKLCM